MSIEFRDGAVCYAFNHQWRVGDKIGDGSGGVRSVDLDVLKSMVEKPDFQLNTIKQGDCMAVSELDTEQKYNYAVEVFGLFGFGRSGGFYLGYADFMAHLKEDALICSDGLLMGVGKNHSACKRKIAFNQLMAIGELKRLEVKRDKEPKFGKNEDGSMKLVKSNFSEKPNDCKDGGKYYREIIGLDGTKTTVDVYRILDAFKTGCAATDHAVKKMLCAGLRGHKDKLTDYDNAIESLQAAKELLIQKSNNENTN